MQDTRTIFRISGADASHFLQGLVSNDVNGVKDGLVYAALLTPQGKYLADFFLAPDADGILLDADAAQAPALLTRLNMYKLRADVTIEETPLQLHRGLGTPPEDGWQDPRDPAMGWRAYRPEPPVPDDTDWDALRVRCRIPQAGIELGPDSYLLEMGFERLHGVDFRKGCYVGQEVTARMKHKTELRKGLAVVDIEGTAEPGTPITRNGRPVGTLHTRSGNRALAYLRFDRAGDDMQVGDARVSWQE